MKKRTIALLTALLILCSLILPASAQPEEGERGLTILFTHDLHDHILPMPNEGGGEYGGYARLMTLLKQQREQAEYPTVTLDGGDFSMGSLFQVIYASHAHELRLMGAMGYDVTTLGNHEFDCRATGFAQMLNAAAESGDKLPALVQVNYKPPESDRETWSAWENYGISDYVVLEREGLRIAVFGLMGQDADDCAPMSGMVFEPIADAARRTVDYLEENEKPDLIVCLSHTGTSGGEGEDYELAKAVDGIDVIISGHTHTTLKEPIQVNDTLIVSCGEYSKNLGVLTVKLSADGTVTPEKYELIPVDETVEEDREIEKLVKKYQDVVSEEYLKEFGYTFEQVLATTDFDFTPFSQFAEEQREDGLGSLIADGYIYAVKQAEGENYEHVDFAVVAAGVIRGSFAEGDITVADAFNVSSLGSGADGTPGYPLVSVYLTGAELKDVFEVDASVTPLMGAAQLYGAGMTWSYNTNRMIFNKVTECGQVLDDGTVVELEDEQLYRVVSGLYSAQMLGTVNAKSFGLLTVTPKDSQGNPITDFEEHIIHDADGNEVKEWVALASWLDHLDQVPAEYSQEQGRKVVYSSWNPIQLLKNANWITLLVLLIIVLLILAVVLIVRAIVLRKSKRRYGRHSYRGSSNYRGKRRKR